MLLLASALVAVACERAPDYDPEAPAGRYELKFDAQGDFEFSIQNGNLHLERFTGAGPSNIHCTYSQPPPPRATLTVRSIEGKSKPKVVEGRIRLEKTNGPQEIRVEWAQPNYVYKSPRSGSTLPNKPLARSEAAAFDNAIEGRLTLEAKFKTETLVYVRGEKVHVSPRLPDAKLTQSQPLPTRPLRSLSGRAKGCQVRTVTDPSEESGWTAVIAVTPKRFEPCKLELTWKR